MGKRKAFMIIGAWLALALLDGLLTYIGTPDLALEGNPLVAYWGLGWGALFTANALVFAAYSLVVYYSFALYERPTIDVTNLKEYVSMLFYNRPDRFRWIFYRLRMNWRPAVAISGYAFSFASLLARAILVFEWAIYLAGVSLPGYHTLRRMTPFGRLDITAALLVALFFMIYWPYREYQHNKLLLAAKSRPQARY